MSILSSLRAWWAAWLNRRADELVDLHDAEGVAGAPARLAAALPAMIDGLHERGYALTTLTDLLDPENGHGHPTRAQ